MRENGQLSTVGMERAFRPPVVVQKHRMSGGKPQHRHALGELVCSTDGVLTVHLETGAWVAPPHRAVWIPPGVEHRVTARRRCNIVVLYADPGRVEVPPEGRVVALDPLARELLRAAASFEASYRPGTPEERLIDVLLDRLPRVESVPVRVPRPRDPRLCRLCAMLDANPADRRTLDELAVDAGMSGRTANRLFREETRLTFAHWRQQVRVLAALELLGEGKSVSEVSLAVGYRDASTFIEVFRSVTGRSPGKYFGSSI